MPLLRPGFPSGLARFVAVLASSILCATHAAAQTTYTVTRFDDNGIGTLEAGGGFGPGLQGDLRYGMFQAMASGGANTINFACATPPCTIVLSAPLPPLFETATSGAQAISSFSLTIDGGTPGNVMIDGASAYRVFWVDNVAVTLKNMVIQNALAQGGAGFGGGGGGAGFGAGIVVNQFTANVTIQNTRFTNVAVTGGAGSDGASGGGGGLTSTGGAGDTSNGSGGGGGGATGPGSAAGGGNGGNGGAGGGGGGAAVGAAMPGSGGSAYGGNAIGGGGGGGPVVDGGNGGFAGGGGGGTLTGGNGGFGGGGGSGQNQGGLGGYGGGGGGGSIDPASGGNGLGGGGNGGPQEGGGGAAAGPAIFVVNGSVSLYNTSGAGFLATGGVTPTGAASNGTANAIPVFNYGGVVNGSKTVGPIANAFTVTQAIGSTSAVQTATLTFTTAGTASAINVLTQGATGLDFILASPNSGSCDTVASHTVGDTCTVQYAVRPIYPGNRFGAITLTSGTTVLASTLISAIGTGPQLTFQNESTAIQTLGGGFSFPYGVTVDSAGNVFVGDLGNNQVKEIPAGCVTPACVSTLGGGFLRPNIVAIDGAGNLYVADSGNNSVKLVPPGCSNSSCVRTLGGGFHLALGVAVDAIGDVYVADSFNSAVKVIPPACSSASCVTTLGGGFSFPSAVAVDENGNVYVTDQNNNAVKEIPPGCTSALCVSTLGNSFNQPDGVAVDSSGNVYVSDQRNRAVREIPVGCTTSACVTTVGRGFAMTGQISLDGAGDIYVADATNNAIKEITLATPPAVTFPTATPAGTIDSTDGTQAITVSNAGNQPLIFVSPTPDVSSGFSLGSESTACTQLSSATLAVGATCTLTAGFAPNSSQSGAVTGSLALTDNNLNAAGAQQSIALNGTAFTLPNLQTNFDQYVTTMAQGSSINFDLLLSSANAAPVSSISVTVQLPTGLTYVSYAAGTCGGTVAVAGSTLTLSGIQLTAYGLCQASIALAATTGGPQSVTSTLSVAGASGAPQYSQINVSQTLSTANSTLVLANNSAVAGGTTTVTATLVDVAGNPIDNANVSFSGSSLNVSFGNETGSGNTITASVSDTAAESVTIYANFMGAGGGLLSTAAQFVAPAYLVSVASDPSTGNGSPSNCMDPNLPAYTVSANANCSLRDAVAAANALSGVTPTITFDPALTANATLASPTVISLAQSTVMTLNQSLNIAGPGAGLLTLSGGTTPGSTSNYKIFIMVGGTTTLSGMTLANGHNAIWQKGGTLTVDRMQFTGNRSDLSTNYGGGAILSMGNLTITNSTFAHNSTDISGGAINAQSVVVSNSTFDSNNANSNNPNIFGSFNGGAIFAFVSATVSNSTFVGNQGYDPGGAIFGVTANVTDSIFSYNQAYFGAAIATQKGGTATNVVYEGPYGLAASAFYNVTTTNVISAPANLSALGYWGGWTETFLPLPGSSAICTGSAPTAPTDQRGVQFSTSRYSQAGCYDIGAVQTAYAMSFTQSPSDAVAGQTLSPSAVVTVSENSTALSAGTANVVMSAAAGTLSGTLTQAASPTDGQANFGDLSFGSVETGDSLTATLNLNNSVNLTATSATFNITAPITPTLSFLPIGEKHASDAPFQVTASSNSPGSITYRLVSGPAIVSPTGLVSLTGAGTIQLQASQFPSGIYGPVTTTTSFLVTSASVWTANASGSVGVLDLQGNALSPTGFAGGGLGSIGSSGTIAFDSSSNVWVASSSGLSEFSLDGVPLTGSVLTGGGLNSPKGIAIDGSGNVWASNANGALSAFTPAGQPISPATGYTSLGRATSNGVGIDISGNVWLAGRDTVTEVLGAAAPTIPLAAGVSGGNAAVKP